MAYNPDEIAKVKHLKELARHLRIKFDGDTDPGACGNGLREADVALSIGKLVEKYLKAVGYDVKLFQFDGLQTICDTANDWHADLFVSFHCNAGGDTGTETYYFQGSANGETLAAFIQKQIIKSLPVANRGIKYAKFYVLKYTDKPTVLVETTFIEDDFARAIARSVSDFYALPKPDVIDAPCRH